MFVGHHGHATQRPIHAHQHGLHRRLLASVALADLPQDHRRTNHPLGQVVVARLRIVQEREQLVGVLPQSLGQPGRVGVPVRRLRQRQPPVDPPNPRPVLPASSPAACAAESRHEPVAAASWRTPAIRAVFRPSTFSSSRSRCTRQHCRSVANRSTPPRSPSPARRRRPRRRTSPAPESPGWGPACNSM